MQARGFDQSVIESNSDVEVHHSKESIRFVPVVDTASVGLLLGATEKSSTEGNINTAHHPINHAEMRQEKMLLFRPS